jgi:hypothetical protein
MPKHTPAQKAAAMTGFIVFGLSPSFEDFKQSPEDRPKMIWYYVVGLSLIYVGLFGKE